jgi:hypothetical protein
MSGGAAGASAVWVEATAAAPARARCERCSCDAAERGLPAGCPAARSAVQKTRASPRGVAGARERDTVEGERRSDRSAGRRAHMGASTTQPRMRATPRARLPSVARAYGVKVFGDVASCSPSKWRSVLRLLGTGDLSCARRARARRVRGRGVRNMSSMLLSGLLPTGNVQRAPSSHRSVCAAGARAGALQRRSLALLPVRRGLARSASASALLSSAGPLAQLRPARLEELLPHGR